uniref:Uncharacterized protein n=1 Tax=uncultured Caudovirales phage TaxID=2100421 RepID=A0A6J5KV69_9CAUD|nr:hypothetical protein UFOVP88_37 [uncultured Caudovirales phage]
MVGKGGPIGNEKAKKLKTPDLRKEAYRQFCEHIAQGYPIKAWSFKYGDLIMSWRCMLGYIKQHASELPPLHKEVAHSQGLKVWIDKGIKNMERLKEDGKVFEPAIYQIMMRNMFGWDKEDQDKREVKSEAETLLEEWNKAPVTGD